MAYDHSLADRVREILAEHAHLQIEEKKMFRGMTFMVNDKMCVSVSGDELMIRVDPALTDEIAEKEGCRIMIHNGRTYKGYFYICPDVLKREADLRYWIDLALHFNSTAKASGKKK